MRSIAVAPGDVLLGGAFTGLGTVASGNLAAVSPDATLPCALITIGSRAHAAGRRRHAVRVHADAHRRHRAVLLERLVRRAARGLSLDGSTGAISGTPTATGVTAVEITVRDANGCTGSIARSFVIAGAPAVTAVVPQTTGLCLNPAQACVTVPFALTRGESTPLRSVTVTFHVESAKLALCAAGPWATASTPATGRRASRACRSPRSRTAVARTVTRAISSGACGPTTGGTLFSLDLKSLGYDGTAASRSTRSSRSRVAARRSP